MAISALALFLPAAYVAVHVAENANEAKKNADYEFEKITQKTLKIHIDDAMRVCQIVQKMAHTAFDNAVDSLKDALASMGTVHTGNQFVWLNAYQQSFGENTVYLEAPIIEFGTTVITPKTDDKGNAVANNQNIEKIISLIKKDTLIDASILTKIDEAGTLLRLATTLKNNNSNTMIASTLDDTAETSEIVRTILARKSYHGVLKIGDERYMAVYEPIQDQYGEVIGAMELLKKFTDFEYVFDYFENIRLGEDGYLWAIQMEGTNAVSLKFFRNSKETSQSLSDTKDLGFEISEIVDSAVNAGDSRVSTRSTMPYTTNGGREMMTAFTYFKAWNMILGATIYKDNFDAGVKKTKSKIEQLTTSVFPLLAIISTIAFALSLMFYKRIIGTIATLSKSILLVQSSREKIAVKELAEEKSSFISIDEIEQMRSLMLKTAQHISKLVESVWQKTSKLSEESTEMFEKSAHIEKIAETKASKLSDIQNSLTSISKTAEILHEDSAEASEGIKISILEMKEGSALLGALEENAKTLIADSQNIELQLSIIKDKADKVANVVDSIKTVSERINMLAVNASIEAERSGEIAGGFKDVANEITKLSDTTAVSAMRISEMAVTMCKSVNSGVSEMKEFSLIMQGCKESVKNVRESVFAAQETTLELAPQFDDLASGIDAHADTISNIEKNLTKLSEKSSESKQTVARLKRRTSTVNATTSAIKLKLKNFSPEES